MRAVILADIHSNIWALEAVFRREKRYDAVYCAGDVVDYGFEPSKVIAFARDHGFVSVCGNHDTGLLKQTREIAEKAAESHEMRWQHDNFLRMSDEDRAFLRALPAVYAFDMDGIHYRMLHQMNDTRETPQYSETFDALWDNERGSRRLILGHTHVPGHYRLDNEREWINPGSVSYRSHWDRSGDRRAHYMVVEDGCVRFEAAEYDRAPLLKTLYERCADPRLDRCEAEIGKYLLDTVYVTLEDAIEAGRRIKEQNKEEDM